jgi:penicillin-binding protein 2
VVKPYLHKKEGEATPSQARGRSVPFPEEHLDLIRKGMRDVVTSGTGKKIAADLAVTCAGKTGTAEIGKGDTKRKNTWVIAFAPFDRPTVAMAMVVERGESGGSTVAPRIHAVFAHIFGETEVAAARPRGTALERAD